ncbi:ferredoxin [Halobacteriales archaeon SW_7_68_16]|nr:MAG: ferredoxin [Halobacteriales archaeon SW_7_68_16]
MGSDADTESDEGMIAVASLDDLQEDGRAVVQADGQAIALFHHEGHVHAIDNRCPHMGFPLTAGTVEDGVLTCHWHHARFELEEGDTFDPWADDVQTFPTAIEDGDIYVDPDPPRTVPLPTHWRNRLADGLQENIDLVLAKAVIGLDRHAEGDRGGFDRIVETAVEFGTKYRAGGWGRGLTTLGCMADLYDHVGPQDRRRALYTGVRAVADDCAGKPPRFRNYAFENRDVSLDRLRSWIEDTVAVRDEDGTERCLLTAVESETPTDVADLVVAAATDSRYLNDGHTLDFVNTALETLDHVGRADHAAPVLAATVPQLTDATRAEEQSAWRRPVDVAALCVDANDRLPDLIAAGRDRKWERPDDFVETLLGDDPEAIVDALTGAIRAGATREDLADAVARAATRRVAYFATNNEFRDWNTVHHTFSYANAVHRLSARTTTPTLYRACFDGAISVYLDRFLNQPRAPVPDPGGEDRDPEAIREAFLDCFDRQGAIEEAARLVAAHFDVGGSATALKRVLGRGLLREDATFHTRQHLQAAIQRHEYVDDDRGRRLALIAAARYMAAHFPTRRQAEETFSIATRLDRGERLHEST